MHKGILWLFVAVFLIAPPAFARSPCAPMKRAPTLNASFPISKVTYDFNHSAKQIALKSGNKHRPGGRSKTAGLTAAKISYKMSLMTQTVSKKGGYCVYPAQIDMEIGYPSMMVYIDKAYRKGSCEYNETYKHEMAHVGIYHSTLKHYQDYFIREAKKAAASMGPVFIRSSLKKNSTTEELMEAFSQQVEPAFNFVRKVQDQENAKLDTAENYAYTSALCWNK